MSFRSLAILLLLGLAVSPAAAALANACDDAMGGDNGSSLRKISVRTDAKSLPAAQAWAVPLIKQAVSSQSDLDAIFTWPKGSPRRKGCKLLSYTYRKLCVPASGAKGDFRVKLRLRTSCGTMVVKYRIAVSGSSAWTTMWGRSKT